MILLVNGFLGSFKSIDEIFLRLVAPVPPTAPLLVEGNYKLSMKVFN